MVLEFITTDLILFATSFIFVFAIVFALLVYIKIFEQSRGAIAAISAVIAFSAAIYQPLAAFLWIIMPIASVILVVLFFLVFIKKILEGPEEHKPRDMLPATICLAFALLLTGVFWKDISNILGLGILSENILWVIGIFIIIMIFYAVYRHGTAAPTGPPT